MLLQSLLEPGSDETSGRTNLVLLVMGGGIVLDSEEGDGIWPVAGKGCTQAVKEKTGVMLQRATCDGV